MYLGLRSLDKINLGKAIEVQIVPTGESIEVGPLQPISDADGESYDVDLPASELDHVISDMLRAIAEDASEKKKKE